MAIRPNLAHFAELLCSGGTGLKRPRLGPYDNRPSLRAYGAPAQPVIVRAKLDQRLGLAIDWWRFATYTENRTLPVSPNQYATPVLRETQQTPYWYDGPRSYPALGRVFTSRPHITTTCRDGNTRSHAALRVPAITARLDRAGPKLGSPSSHPHKTRRHAAADEGRGR